MNILFVCSGNNGVTPIVKAQADSLIQAGLNVQITPIVGKGLFGYLSYLPRLRSIIRKENPDLIHAHYSFCGFVAALASSKPVITSLMGSDVKRPGIWPVLIKFFIKNIWKFTIVKSADMKNNLNLDELIVLPNGVDTDTFRHLDRRECRKQLGWSDEKKIVLFAADPTRPEKNFALAQEAIARCNDHNMVLKVVHHVEQCSIPIYLNASNVLLLTSIWEGSPNIVKEAMACDIHVVSTDVGDVKWLFGDAVGLYMAEHNSDDVMDKVRNCLNLNDRSEGRKRIFSLGLDSAEIAHKIINIYTDACRVRGE